MGPRAPIAVTALATLMSACGSESGDSAAAAAGDWPGAFEADRAHYSVIRDNDVARILRADYGPGEASSMHAHPDYCFLFLDDAPWVVTAVDGSTVNIQVRRGDFDCNAAGVHQPGNASTGRARVVVIEFKEGASAGTNRTPGSDAIQADPQHYSPLVETDAVRISRVSYRAGESGVEHGHPAHCAIWLSDPAGPAEVGTVECHLALEHAPLVPDGAAELVLIEFLGRAVG